MDFTDTLDIGIIRHGLQSSHASYIKKIKSQTWNFVRKLELSHNSSYKHSKGKLITYKQQMATHLKF